jgi:hypothetical protein
MIDKSFHRIREHIKLWTKPATSVLISGLLSDVARSRANLVVENALLRQQLIVLNRQVKRPPVLAIWFIRPGLLEKNCIISNV